MSEDKITVKYQTRRHSCHCCEQVLVTPETSEVREFDFYLEDVKEWTDWSYHVTHQEQLRESADNYVCETISFFAADSEDFILLGEGELDKFVQYIITKFTKQQ